jgi:hypothetical protein
VADPKKLLTCVVFVLAPALSGEQAVAQQSYDFDFATIHAPNNPAFTADNPPNPLVVGRGSVPYEYRIAKTEITTGQWLEFVNTFSNVAAPNPYWDQFGPGFWGAIEDLSFPGPGIRYNLRNVPNATQLPVSGISWRQAALYTNWLTNGKQSSPASLVTGSYDTSTWGVMPGTNGRGITDAPTHLPGALFWIPTLDEQLKAMHYDPNRYGEGQGGWWMNKNMSDLPGIPGLPGVGTTSAGLVITDPPFGVWDIPLGAYPNSVSPWGLWDTSGGTREWAEELISAPFPRERAISGSWAGWEPFDVLDSPFGTGSVPPDEAGSVNGLRIASQVPSNSTSVILVGGCGVVSLYRIRRT